MCQAAIDLKEAVKKDSTILYEAGYCDGLVQGVSYMRVLTDAVCFREGITPGQRIRVVIKYLNDHPAELDEEGAYLVAKAMHQAFPCPENK